MKEKQIKLLCGIITIVSFIGMASGTWAIYTNKKAELSQYRYKTPIVNDVIDLNRDKNINEDKLPVSNILHITGISGIALAFILFGLMALKSKRYKILDPINIYIGCAIASLILDIIFILSSMHYYSMACGPYIS